MKLQILFLVMLFAFSSNAQEETTGEVNTPLPRYSGGNVGSYRFKAIFDSFKNQSFRSSGLTYGAELGYQSIGEFSIYGGVPYLYGQTQGKNVSELGNPYVGGEALFFESAGIQTWGSLEHKFSRPEAEIAARHNTAIPGFDIRYERSKTVASLGANYHLRYGENDSSVDVKDVVSAHASFGRKLSRRLTLEAEVLWYRAFGVKKGDLVFARECDWAGAGPVARIYLGSGVMMKSSLLFPIHNSRSQAETEVAVWDATLPKVSEVTWKTDVGVQF
jgi:hypothetical protein